MITCTREPSSTGKDLVLQSKTLRKNRILINVIKSLPLLNPLPLTSTIRHLRLKTITSLSQSLKVWTSLSTLFSMMSQPPNLSIQRDTSLRLENRLSIRQLEAGLTFNILLLRFMMREPIANIGSMTINSSRRSLSIEWVSLQTSITPQLEETVTCLRALSLKKSISLNER